jgi:O-antigen ligase
MMASYASIFFLGLALAWAATNKSGVMPFDWYVSMVLIGLASVSYWSRRRQTLAPPLPKWLQWTIMAVVLYMAFQLLPLPLSLLAVLSPARAELARALQPITGSLSSAPLSVNPPADLLWLLTLLGCLAAFFLLRELALRFKARPGLVLSPLLAVATFEAVLGLVQVRAGATQATGTYNGRDHYVCILELSLPITIAYGMVLFSRPKNTGTASFLPMLAAAGVWLLAGIQLLAILASLSRAGILDTLIALLAIALLFLYPRLSSPLPHIVVVISLLLGLAAVLIFASPAALLARLADTDTQSEGRFLIWSQALPLHKAFAWFGTGLMGFDPTFLKYQASMNAQRVDFAHNDYLQYLIELGILGFLPLMASVGGVIWPIFSAALRSGRERRILVVGCTGSLLALAVHSFFDFNLYVPANVLASAWVMGCGSVFALTWEES